MDLQPLFDQPILEQVLLDPGYSGHANDVWRVRTAAEEVVVRSFRGEGPVGPFWCGCAALFGVEAGDIFGLEPLNVFLAGLSPLRVPRVLRKGVVAGRRCVVVELMPGVPLRDFRGQPAGMLYELGRALAMIHSLRFAWVGNPSGTFQLAPEAWHEHMVTVMRDLAATFFSADPVIAAALEPASTAALALPPPAMGVLTMVDLDPSQFLTDGERISALVDTEAYVVGPRELDFVALEYVLDPPAADALAHGYRSLAPLPALAMVRPVYRYLYRLLEVQGDVELGEWMAWPVLFGRG